MTGNYPPAVKFSSSSGMVILSPMEVIFSSIVMVIFSPPDIFWARAGANSDKPNPAATIANATKSVFVFIPCHRKSRL